MPISVIQRTRAIGYLLVGVFVEPWSGHSDACPPFRAALIGGGRGARVPSPILPSSSTLDERQQVRVDGLGLCRRNALSPRPSCPGATSSGSRAALVFCRAG